MSDFDVPPRQGGQLIRELLDRRVPQYVGLYVVGGWGFVQFVDWAVDQYLLSADLTNVVVALLILFLPSVVVLAWRYGARGDDRWKPRDAAAVALNVAVAAAVLFGLFRDLELRARTTLKLLEDAEGDTVARVVPTAAARRDILLFDFENETGDPELDWMEHGLTTAISLDLLQDIFVNVESLFTRPVRERAAVAGFESGDDVPLALMQDIAAARGMDFFVDGTIERAAEIGGAPLLARVRLHDTRSGRIVASHEYSMTGPLDAADRISRDLRAAAGIPEEHLEESPDLPVAELSTHSPEAFRNIVEGRARMGRTQDPAAALPLLKRAAELDPTSALAQSVLATAAAGTGDRATMVEAAEAALEHNYRLPEQMRLASEIRAQLVAGDVGAALRTARYWTERYPQDLAGHQRLAGIYQRTGDEQGRLRALRGILALDPTDVETLQYVAYLYAQQGEADSLVRYMERARELRPDDVELRLNLAAGLADVGRFDAAREALEAAAAVAARDPDVARRRALVDLRRGELEAAFERLAEVKARERTPTEIERRVGLEETLYYVTGRFDRLEDAYRRRLALLAANASPIDVTTSIDGSEFLWYAAEAGRSAEALAQIDSLKTSVESPWNLQLAFPAARIHLDDGDPEGARAALADLSRLAEAEGRQGWIEARISWVEGRLAELEDGDCRRALASYDLAVERLPTGRYTRTTRLECLTSLRSWNAAQEDADWLLEHWPGWPTSRLAIAGYLVARGRLSDAAPHLDYALRAWSDADLDYLPAREARALREVVGAGN